MNARLFFILVVGLTLYVMRGCFFNEPYRADAYISEEPVQTNLASPRSWKVDKYLFTAKAHIQLKALVLSAAHYRFDENSSLSPVDLALGWKEMSQAAILNQLSISQSYRWFNVGWKTSPPPLPESTMFLRSANMHLIPADDSIRRSLKEFRKNDIAVLEGDLVTIEMPNGGRWVSSLSRSDRNGNSCEVVWVTKAEKKQSLSD